ncbi:hypothetical protein L227DRAFT_654474, partial [Lentinus tigrinus ALCF2SS1-6]
MRPALSRPIQYPFFLPQRPRCLSLIALATLASRNRPIGLASYVYSLDNQTTSNYLAFATSYFGSHSLISSIQVAQSILAFRPSRLRKSLAGSP